MNKHEIKTASGSGAQPPHQVPPLPNAHSQPPSLTPVFNAAAQNVSEKPSDAVKKPMGVKALREQLKKLRNSLSKHAATLERSPLGSVVKGINAKRDARIGKELEQIAARLKHAEKQGVLKNAFSTAAHQDVAKQAFNRSAKRSM